MVCVRCLWSLQVKVEIVSSEPERVCIDRMVKGEGGGVTGSQVTGREGGLGVIPAELLTSKRWVWVTDAVVLTAVWFRPCRPGHRACVELERDAGHGRELHRRPRGRSHGKQKETTRQQQPDSGGPLLLLCGSDGVLVLVVAVSAGDAGVGERVRGPGGGRGGGVGQQRR